MDSSDAGGSGGRRRAPSKHSAEDQALNQIAKEAEARLAARRLARAEAREIRMRELERQQRELDESASDMSYTGRRSSEDSLEDVGSSGAAALGGPSTPAVVQRDISDLEEKFRKAMVQSAQLDNEKASLSFQVELFKDKLEELEEAHGQVQRELRNKTRESDQFRREATRFQEDRDGFRAQLEERDRLIAEAGLAIVCDDDGADSEESGGEGEHDGSVASMPKKALVSQANADLLAKQGAGTLDVRLKRLASDRDDLADQVRHLELDLEEERGRRRNAAGITGLGSEPNSPPTNAALEEIQRENSKLIAEYKFKLQKSEQDLATLQANVARLESQVVRYKSQAETSEKAEGELKVEKRKLQRELREAQARVDELETSNNHLQKRMDKLKNAKSALLKEL